MRTFCFDDFFKISVIEFFISVVTKIDIYKITRPVYLVNSTALGRWHG
ncbi:MAG: hypothetical protein Q7S32_02485 [bacterium]|nr:hypothetical protein [bacterium]